MSCTTLLVGKNASYDGSTLIARNDDSGGGRYDPKRFVAVKPTDQPRRYRSTLSHVQIDLPDNPCAYVMAPNALRNRGILAEAGVSERNVAMSATETIAVNERVLGADPMVVLRPAKTNHTASNSDSASPKGPLGDSASASDGGGSVDNASACSNASSDGTEGDEPAQAALAVDRFWAVHGEPKAYDSGIPDTGLKVADLFDYDASDGDNAGNGVGGNTGNSAGRNIPADLPSDAEQTEEIPGGIGEEDIITLVLPYVSTAREGVQRLGGLVETYGTYEANGISISDGNEVWYVETIGGHHWIARRVPDDCYAAIPNQLGIDDFDLTAALAGTDEHGAPSDFMASADLREFIEDNHLDCTMDQGPEHWRHLNPRKLFGTATVTDHVYNTPRAWYMERCLNPSEDWDSPSARYTPLSDDIPWCRVPEAKVSIEDVHRVLSSHYEDTPYDPYGHRGTDESRHRFRPIGISRTGHLAIMQIRSYMPEAFRSVMWLAFGPQPFTAPMPFYTAVGETPAYLRDTTGEVDTHTLYWTNRLIAVIADAQYDLNASAIEAFHEDVMSHGHTFVEQTDAVALRLAEQLQSVSPDSLSSTLHAIRTLLERANQRASDYLERRNAQLLGRVLNTSSDHMKSAFALSDRPH